MLMKRLLLITAVLGGAALVPLAAQAQRGGGGHGVASAHMGGGVAARPAGRAAMGAVRPAGMRVASARSRFSTTGRIFPRNRFVFNNRFRFRDRRFFNNCFNTLGSFGGFGCSSAFLGGYPLYDPLFNDYGNGAQQPPPQQPVVAEDDNDNRDVAFELQALRDEMLAMREDARVRDERNNAAAKGPAQQDESNAVLIFRDGRQLSVRNYAIADHTVWVLGPNNARKIAVAELDVPATEQMNAKNGVEFRLPQ
jgi:hypothetical protein